MQVASSSSRAWICNQWPVAKMILSQVSKVNPVSVCLWKQLSNITSLGPPENFTRSTGPGSPEKGGQTGDDRNGLASAGIVPASIQRALERECWKELEDNLRFLQAPECSGAFLIRALSLKTVLGSAFQIPFRILGNSLLQPPVDGTVTSHTRRMLGRRIAHSHLVTPYILPDGLHTECTALCYKLLRN